MNAPLIAAGLLALIGAAIHGVGGERLVVQKIAPTTLPATRFGGPAMTKTMIHAAWHMTTIAFMTVGLDLLVAGVALSGDTARGLAVTGAAASTGFAALVFGMGGAYKHFPRGLLRHPAPVLLTATAVLAWWGVALAG